jgi:hypothetical protein
MNAYILVEIAKRKQGIDSDREFALRNGFTKQNIVDWKSGKSLPVWDNMEKLADAAGLELWEAVKAMKEAERKLKQAGFVDMGMLGVLTGMSFLAVSPTPEALTGAAVGGAILASIHYANI